MKTYHGDLWKHKILNAPKNKKGKKIDMISLFGCGELGD